MIETEVGILTVPELGVLVALNVDLADRFQAIADDPEAEPETQRTAEALAAWRRARARYFREECARTDRFEAAEEIHTSACNAQAEVAQHFVMSRGHEVMADNYEARLGREIPGP